MFYEIELSKFELLTFKKWIESQNKDQPEVQLEDQPEVQLGLGPFDVCLLVLFPAAVIFLASILVWVRIPPAKRTKSHPKSSYDWTVPPNMRI